MQRMLTGCLLLAVLAPLAGCGGVGVTEAEMKRRAAGLSRSKDNDDEPPAGTAAPAAPPAPSLGAAPPPAPTAIVAAPAPAAANPTPASQISVAAAPAAAPSTQAAPASANLPPPFDERPRNIGSEPERRRQTVKHLEKIAAALEAYIRERNHVPTAANFDFQQNPLLSWRVHLLPYLGYGDLYKSFHLDEPWFSPRNKALLSRIPPEYQSPERLDEKTNYLVPLSPSTAFNGTHPKTRENITDGLQNTILLLEVDDELAVPWTKPDDFNVQSDAPRTGLGRLRENVFFVAWGSGIVSQIPLNTSDVKFRAALSIDGGEAFSFADVAQEPAVAEPAAVAAAPASSAPSGASPGPAPPATPGVAAAAAPGGIPPLPPPPPDARTPVPTEIARAAALQVIRRVYEKEYTQVASAMGKLYLARRLHDDLQRVKDDPVGLFVMLREIRIAAADGGDLATALAAADEIVSRYQVLELEEKLAVLRRFNAMTGVSSQVNMTILELTSRLVEQAFMTSDFAAIDHLFESALAAARRQGDSKMVDMVQERYKEAQLARAVYPSVEEAEVVLARDPNDPHANFTAGRYECLVQGTWEKGLRKLAVGDDWKLNLLARLELRRPLDPKEQITLAQGWWELSAQYAGLERKRSQLRAMQWYAEAAQRLPNGLERVRLERGLAVYRDTARLTEIPPIFPRESPATAQASSD